MDRDVIAAYLGETRRVLRKGGTAIIHHSNVEDSASHRQDGSPGWRSAFDAETMRRLAEGAGLTVVSQFAFWDEARRIGAALFGDRITHLRRD